jgi:hypothetical protein
MAKKSEEMVKAPSTAISNSAIPEHLQKFAGTGATGLENLSNEDFIMPRLAIAQSMSPQRQKNDPLFIKGLEEGQFFNTLSQKIYGESVRVVPLYAFKSRIFFPARGSNDPILCSTNKIDEDKRLVEGRITPEGCDICPHSQFLSTPRPDGSTRPDCTLFYNYIVAVPLNGVFEPMALSLKSKMIKPAKVFNTKMRIRNMPGFTMLFDIRTVAEKAPKGTFYNLVVEPAGDVTAEEVAQTHKLFEALYGREHKIDLRGSDEDFGDEGGRDARGEM